MSWKIALVVAVLTALITAIITAPVADKVTRLTGVSDMEGGRGMLIVFVLIPAGFVGGFLLGLLGTKLAGAVEWPQFWKAAGLSLLLSQVALFGIAGLSLLSMPRAPEALEQPLAVELEVQVPLDMLAPGARERGAIRMSLTPATRITEAWMWTWSAIGRRTVGSSFLPWLPCSAVRPRGCSASTCRIAPGWPSISPCRPHPLRIPCGASLPRCVMRALPGTGRCGPRCDFDTGWCSGARHLNEALCHSAVFGAR
jgi:hypothetical protein